MAKAVPALSLFSPAYTPTWQIRRSVSYGDHNVRRVGDAGHRQPSLRTSIHLDRIDRIDRIDLQPK